MRIPLTIFILAASLCLILASSSAFGQKTGRAGATVVSTAIPGDLPQTGSDKERPSTDLRDEAFKGKVRSVKEYCQGTIFSETQYNEAGNRVRHIEYNHGDLMAITVYGYLDGMRVWRTQYFEPTGERQSDPPEWKTQLDRDRRYSEREVRKYDAESRLTEQLTFDNNGERLSRVVYSYERDLLKTRFYNAEERVASTMTEKLDANGHVVEDSREDGLNDDKKWISVHKIDRVGNWIFQRTHMEQNGTRSKDFPDDSIRTRAIKYYAEAKSAFRPPGSKQ